MITTSDGNMSIRDARGDLWITPARGAKGSLHWEEVRVKKQNERSHLSTLARPF